MQAFLTWVRFPLVPCFWIPGEFAFSNSWMFPFIESGLFLPSWYFCLFLWIIRKGCRPTSRTRKKSKQFLQWYFLVAPIHIHNQNRRTNRKYKNEKIELHFSTSAVAVWYEFFKSPKADRETERALASNNVFALFNSKHLYSKMKLS